MATDHHRSLIAACTLLLALSSNAQIVELANASVRYDAISSLEQAGPKLFSWGSTGFQVANMDMTPYTSCTYPPPPFGHAYNSIPQYITEALFDTDPTTIEFMIQTYNAETNSMGTLIARTDGTVLLSDTAFTPGGINGVVPVTSSPPVIPTPDGTVLVLVSAAGTGSRTYSLPGSLPCLDCSGAIVTGDHELSGGIAQLSVFPNPGADRVQVLSGRTDPSDMLKVFQSDGRLVGAFAPRTNGLYEIPVAGLVAGNYKLVLVGAQGATQGAGQLIVVH